MRQYEPIWIKLKNMPPSEALSVGVSITANRYLHRRIIKAMWKEKTQDIAWKLAIEPKTAIMYAHRNQAILKFTLRYRLCSTDF